MLLHSNVFIALCSHHLCSMRGLLFRPQLLNIICLKDGSMNEAYLECTKSQVGLKNKKRCPDDHTFNQPPLSW